EQQAAHEARCRAEQEAAAARAASARLKAEQAVQVERIAAESQLGEAVRTPADQNLEAANHSLLTVWRQATPLRRALAAIVLALAAGMGSGYWLAKPVAVVVPLSERHDRLYLRLDDSLKNPPAEGSRVIPRD
ncbi:MAG: hypothetical protein K9J43_05915, partial [Polynucleobacter sp.]|nr:hypothetical protein [Polynucleobacter sp.]